MTHWYNFSCLAKVILFGWRMIVYLLFPTLQGVCSNVLKGCGNVHKVGMFGNVLMVGMFKGCGILNVFKMWHIPF